jgi:hypothetical protein
MRDFAQPWAPYVEEIEMGLIRLAAIAAVGIALLPSDREKQAELYSRAASAAHWTVTFCDRNGDTCTQASGLWDQFLKKAEFGAKLAYDVVRENPSPSSIETGSTSPGPAASRAPANTLTDSDLKPQWRGKVSDRKGN